MTTIDLLILKDIEKKNERILFLLLFFEQIGVKIWCKASEQGLNLWIPFQKKLIEIHFRDLSIPVLAHCPIHPVIQNACHMGGCLCNLFLRWGTLLRSGYTCFCTI